MARRPGAHVKPRATRSRRRVAAVIVLATAALLGALALGWFPQGTLRGVIESRLRSQFGAESRIGSLRVVPGRLEAEIGGLVLDSPAFRITADRVLVRLSRETLMGRGMIVDQLEMSGGQVLVRSSASTSAAPAASAGPAAPLVIRKLVAKAMTLTVESPESASALIVRSIDLSGGVGEGTLIIAAGGGAWPRPEPLELGPLHLRLVISPQLDVRVESADFGLKTTRVQASGELGRADNLRPDLRFEGRIDLDEIGAIAGVTPASGLIETRGRVWGSLDTMTAEATFSGESLSAAGWPIDRLDGDVKHDSANGAQTTVRVGLLGGEVRLEAGIENAAAQGRGSATGLDIGRLLKQLGTDAPKGLNGVANAALRFEGDPTTEMTIEADAQASGRFGEGERFEGNLTARGPVRFPTPDLGLSWTLALVASDASPRAAETGRLNASGSARGVFPPTIDGKVEGTVALAEPVGPIDLTGQIRARGDRLATELNLTGLGGHAQGNADIEGSRVRALKVTARGIDLGRLGMELSGLANVELSATGPMKALSGTAQARVDTLGFRELNLGPVLADVVGTRGIADIQAAMPLIGATASARVAAQSNAIARGTIILTATPLSTVAPLMPEGRPLEGTITGNATFELPLANPTAASVEGKIDVLQASSGTVAAHATEPFAVGFSDGRVTVRGLKVEGLGLAAQLDLDAGTHEDDPISAHLTVDAALADLPSPEPWSLGGRGLADVKLDGTRASPRAHGFVSVVNASLDSASTPSIRVDAGRLELDGDAILIPGLTATMADGTIRVDGRVPVAAFWPDARRDPGVLRPEEEAQLAIDWSGVQAGVLMRRLAPEQTTPFEAALAGRSELFGGLTSLAEIRGTLTVPATTARVEDLVVDLAPAEMRLEASRVTTDGLEFRAAGGALKVSGSADLETRAVDVSGKGTLDLRALSPFLAETALTGTSVVDLRVKGTLDAPEPAGTVRLTDGTLRMRALPQSMTGIGVDLILDGGTLRIENGRAALGGGTLTASGSARLQGQGIADTKITLTGRDLALRYPEGMRSRLEADLSLTGESGALRLGGTVRALRGLYDLDTALEESLKALPAAAADSPLLRSVALDIRVVTENPVLVRNNLAQLQASGSLTVRGDLQTPAPIGTLDIASGGKIYLQGREFVIGTGRLVYTGTWDPELTLDAAARIPDLDRETGNTRADVTVTVALDGPLSAPRLNLRSEPAYSRLEIVNLVTAGDSQNPGTRLAVSGSAATLLAGRLSRSLSGLGLDQVSIQPELVAREGELETGARFTFGKRLSPKVNLIYSLSLQDPEGRFVQVEGTPWRDVALSVRRTDQGSFTYGAGQRFRFGGTRSTTEAVEQKVRVSEVRLEVDDSLDPKLLSGELRTKAGDSKTTWDLQDDADRLRERLVERGYVEAEVSARFEGPAAVFSVRSGSPYGFRVDGMSQPPDLTRTIRESLFEEEALERGRGVLLKELRQRGHLRAAVETRAEAGETRTLVFEVRPGPLMQAEVTFPGALALSSSDLLKAADGAGRLLADPDAARRDIVAAYAEAFYLDAAVDALRIEGDERVLIAVPVREGERARVAALRFEGTTLNEADLLRVAAIRPGSEYNPERAVAAVDRLRDHYFGLGYAAVRVSPHLEPKGADLDLVLEVVEGERVTVGAVVLIGLRHAREGLVRRQIQLAPGDPLDPRKVAELERRLLDLGLFNRAAATVSDDNPATVTVTLEEGDRIRAGYLMSYNNDRGTRAEVDGELRNLLGAGISTGARVSAGPDIRDARVALSVPALLLPTGRITASLFRLEEDLPLVAGGETLDTFTRVQTGGQIQGTRPIGRLWNVLYGYRLRNVAVMSEFLNSSHRVAGIDLSLLRDTRDNPLDARRGRFFSFSFEFSPKALGSDFDFIKGFGQVFLSRPLSPSLTWAQGYRLGLAKPFGGEPLVGDEGFEAGGANSIRGFASGVVGREDTFFGQQAVIVLNQELRYHHPSGLGAAVFYDAGNTFATVSDFSLRLRHALGLGVRWTSPVGLLRVDLGTPLFPRTGESRYKLFFSFGQAF